MEKFTTIHGFRWTGHTVNILREKPRYWDFGIQYKRNYLIVPDVSVDGNMTFTYYPVQVDRRGDRLFFKKFPALIAGGFLILSKKETLQVTASEVARGRIRIGQRMETYDALVARLSPAIPEPVQKVDVLHLLDGVPLVEYTANPANYWHIQE